MVAVYCRSAVLDCRHFKSPTAAPMPARRVGGVLDLRQRGDMRFFFLLLLALSPLLAGAAEFDEHARRVPLGPLMDIYEDPRGTTTIEQVSAVDFAGPFRRHEEVVFNGGYSRAAYWIRVDLNYRPTNPGQSQRWLLDWAWRAAMSSV